jgi:adenylate cyclase
MTAPDPPEARRLPAKWRVSRNRDSKWWRSPAAVSLRSTLIGGAVLVILLGIWCLPAAILRTPLREHALDLMLPLLPQRPAAGPDIAIVDIDRDTLARHGPWPWPRARLAELVRAVGSGQPAVVAIDILLDGSDHFSAKALLGNAPPALAAALPDGDRLLADALTIVPSILGFGLDNSATAEDQDLPATPVLTSGAISTPDIWQASGRATPLPELAAAAQGLGALVAAADRDGPIRRVPLLVLAGDTLQPGLAVETIRVAEGATALLVGQDGRLHAGAVTAPLGPDASLRLVQPAPAAWASRTLSAWRIIGEPEAAQSLAGRIVLIGSSAPELGGLRVTPASPATPSVQIQAEALSALLRGEVPYRPAWLGPCEVACALLLGALGLLLAARLRPLWAAAMLLGACLLWSGTAIAAVPLFGLLVDPAGPALIALLTFAVATLTRFARDELNARRLRASFEQHLAPDVVRRIAADPTALRLQGEMREITALFTDIEGFTSMTENAEPTDLVALVDAYFDAAAKIVTEHGGLVGKFVGDAVVAIFNAPVTLENHPQRAVDCALALLAASEQVRASTLGQRLHLGRTRIGLETGMAIVGDVGGSRKLDYTAYGNAMNTAARLEAANKELGSSVCIGPGAAARLDATALHEIGTLTLRGQSSPVRVFTPAALVDGTTSPTPWPA